MISHTVEACKSFHVSHVIGKIPKRLVIELIRNGPCLQPQYYANRPPEYKNVWERKKSCQGFSPKKSLHYSLGY